MSPAQGARVSLGILATIAVLTVASAASGVFAPVVFALFIIAMVWPLQKWLQRYIPSMLALLICMIAIAGLGFVFGILIVWAFGRVAQLITADAGRFQALYDHGVTWLAGHGIVVSSVWSEYFNVSWMLRAAQGVTGRINTALSFWIVTLVYVILGLIEVEDAARRIRSLDKPGLTNVLLKGSALTSAKLRRYMLVRTGMSLITGALVATLAYSTGLSFAMEWGVIAFVLNYIPFIGPLIATVFPTLLAMVEFGSWDAVFALFVGLNVIQFIVGSYFEPRLAGSALSMSPFLVLFAVFAWSSLWGIAGAFIGIPITIAVLTFCAQSPDYAWAAQLLGSAPPDKERGADI